MGHTAAYDYCAGLSLYRHHLPMRSLNVLILEDNPFQLMALHQMLNANGVFNVRAEKRSKSPANPWTAKARWISPSAICTWSRAMAWR